MFKHWPVFWVSLATVLTTFGIAMVQGGIFSVKQQKGPPSCCCSLIVDIVDTLTSSPGTIAQIHPHDFVVSRKYIYDSEQERDLTISYARSTFGILKLNDTLPAYMTTEYTLAPFNILCSLYSKQSEGARSNVTYSVRGT
jgi:hypothetical protein